MVACGPWIIPPVASRPDRVRSRAGGQRGAGPNYQRLPIAPAARRRWLSNKAATAAYGIAVTVRASRSLFSLRRCVSKRSPTLNDVMLTKFRPVRE